MNTRTSPVPPARRPREPFAVLDGVCLGCSELVPFVVFEARRVLSRKGPCVACRRRRVVPVVEEEA